MPDLEIKMIMFSAPGIEPRSTTRAAGFALHVLSYAQLCPASPAKYRLLLPLALRPHDNRMPRERLVAIFARVIHAAALHLDRDDVRRPVVMVAASLRIQLDAAHIQ